MREITKKSFEKFQEVQNFSRHIDEGKDLGIGSCVGCNELHVSVKKIDTVVLCAECCERIKESVGLGMPIETLTLDTAKALIFERFTLYMNMQKLQDEADKKYGGDVLALAKDYRVNIWKYDKEKIIIQTKTLTQSKVSRLNKFMIDFDGEYSTDKVALMVTPDSDGTMAPLKVRGKGIITPNAGTVVTPAGGTHHSTTTPASPAPAPKTTPKPSAVKTPPKNVPMKVDSYIAGVKFPITFKEEVPSGYTYSVPFASGGGDFEFQVPKVGISDDMVVEYMADKLDSITRTLQTEYTLNLLNDFFVLDLDMDSLKVNKGVKYTVTVKNTHLEKTISSAVMDKLVVTVDTLMSSSTLTTKFLTGALENLLYQQGVLPVTSTYEILNTKLDIALKSINRDEFVFEVSGSWGWFNMSVGIDDFKRDAGILVWHIEGHINDIDKDAKLSYDIGVMDGAKTLHLFTADLVRGSSKHNKGNLIYNITPKDGSKEFGVEIVKLDDIQGQIQDAIVKELGLDKVQAQAPSSVSDKSLSSEKKEILRQKASPYKELLLKDIAKRITDMLGSDMKSAYVHVDNVVLDNNDKIVKLVITVTDSEGKPEGTTMKEYSNGFTKKAKDAFLWSDYEVHEFGVDGTGNAYLNLSLTDKKFIDILIYELKLDEHINLFRANSKLRYLVESLNKRR